MKCPKCGNDNERLIDTIAMLTHVTIRDCVKCGHGWTTPR